MEGWLRKIFNQGMKIITVLMDLVSLLIILTARERFLLNSNGAGSSSPSITSFKSCGREPKTFLSSHISS